MDRYINATETRNIYGSNNKLTYIDEYGFSPLWNKQARKTRSDARDAKKTSKTYAVSNTSP
jgi:hypothetical protein